MSLICKLFGHKWFGGKYTQNCKNCSKKRKLMYISKELNEEVYHWTIL